MKLKPIVNNQRVTISSCEAEPIHIPGAIQPHGALLACGKTSLRVEFCSQNIQDSLGLPPEQLLNKCLADASEELTNLCRQYIENEFASNIEHTVTVGNKEINVMLHSSGEYIILECTPAIVERLTSQQTFSLAADFGKVIDRSNGLAHLCQLVAEQIRSLSGYDRVMIYRFDKKYNGEVFAESKADGMEPFLHLHYPHTDIPAQARELYVRQLVRIIPDVSFTPVPIVTYNNVDNSALDLSNSHLRSVSPIHIQYLKNMAVGATLTISLLQDGKLWGLIACHHRTAYGIDESRKQAALMLGQLLTSQIRVQESAEEYAVHLQVDAHLQSLLQKLNIHEDFSLQFEQLTSLLAVAGAGGVAILKGGELFTQGRVPSFDKIRLLIKWLGQHIKANHYCTDSLYKKYPAAEGISKQAAGIFYHALGDPEKDCIIWFRPEIEQTISWAGNPGLDNDKTPKDPLTPRTSFALWKETVKHCSQSWKIAEVNAATQFASALHSQFHLQQVQGEQERQRILNEQLRKANQELSNINWITSHDLKEPIRKIQIFASKVMMDEGEDISKVVAHSITKIQESAARMTTLVHDILGYSVISDTNNTVEQLVVLNTIIDEIVVDVQDDIDTIYVGALPSVKAKPSQMRQLFSNLISNSIKYVRPGDKARIVIEAEAANPNALPAALSSTQKYHRIVLRDQGIGFDKEESDKIFDIFFRLHNRTDYEGTGIGLAICKKVVENSGGAIMAHGYPNQGAEFIIYLPVA